MHYFAFEGDFLETRDGLIFDVKGNLHPKDRKIAYLRYIPARFFDSNFQHAPKKEKKTIKNYIEQKYEISVSDIRFGQEVYIKLYDIPSRFKILSLFKPKYIFTSNLYDFPLQSVPNQDIQTIYAPEEYLLTTLQSPKDNTLRNLIDFLQTGGNIPLNHIGLSGSSMVGLDETNSDYDIVIYGEKECLSVHAFLELLFSQTHNLTSKNSRIHTYKSRALRKHYKTRAKGFPIKFKDFSFIERKKTHQFVIDGKDVFIRYSKFHRTNAVLPQFEDFSFKNLGRVSLNGIIVEDAQSIFTPGKYGIKIIEISKGDEKITGKFIEIFTLRGRFLEQGKNGDLVHVEGKLERKENLDTNEISQQIVIGTDPNDLMIQIKKSNAKFN
ncbi:MAG: hypothetical protein EU530_09215 [Promethearchaeota archaeon]|nr:MAG: hypothetical protein EU530_09215 [Candidatus Lokiarchaeota archaeon]